VDHTFSSLSGFLSTIRATFARHNDEAALKLLHEPVRPVHAYNPLVQIETESSELENSRA
jgi:hypothetical protein